MKQPITVVRRPEEKRQGSVQLLDTQNKANLVIGKGLGSLVGSAFKSYGEHEDALAADEAAVRQGTAEAINDEDATKKRNWLSKFVFGGEDPAYAAAANRSTSNVAARMGMESSLAATNPDNANMSQKDFEDTYIKPQREQLDEMYKDDVHARSVAGERHNKSVVTASRQHALVRMDYEQKKRVETGIATYAVEADNAVLAMKNPSSQGERDRGEQELIDLAGSTLEGASPEADMNYKLHATIQALGEDKFTLYNTWNDLGVYGGLDNKQKGMLKTAVSAYDTRQNSRYGEVVHVGLNSALEAPTAAASLSMYDSALIELEEERNTSSGSDVSDRNYEVARGQLLRGRARVMEGVGKKTTEETSADVIYAAEMMTDEVVGNALESGVVGTAKDYKLADDKHMQSLLFNYASDEEKAVMAEIPPHEVGAAALMLTMVNPQAAVQFGSRINRNQRVPKAFLTGMESQVQAVSSQRTDAGMLTTEAKAMIDNIYAMNDSSKDWLFSEMDDDSVQNLQTLRNYQDQPMELYDRHVQNVKVGETYPLTPQVLGYDKKDMVEIITEELGLVDSASQHYATTLLKRGLAANNGNGRAALTYAKGQLADVDAIYNGTVINNGNAAQPAMTDAVYRAMSNPDSAAHLVVKGAWKYLNTDDNPDMSVPAVLKELENSQEMSALLGQVLPPDSGYTSLSALRSGYSMRYDSHLNAMLVESEDFRGNANLQIPIDTLAREYAMNIYREMSVRDVRSQEVADALTWGSDATLMHRKGKTTQTHADLTAEKQPWEYRQDEQTEHSEAAAKQRKLTQEAEEKEKVAADVKLLRAKKEAERAELLYQSTRMSPSMDLLM